MATHRSPLATTKAKLDRWQNDPQHETSISAQIARRLWAGESISAGEVMAEYDTTPSLLGVVVRDLRTAGWQVDQRPDPARGGNARLYRITNIPVATLTATAASPAPPDLEPIPEAPGGSYPPLGVLLRVKALAMTDDGVVVHLSNGDGQAWQATITGHVG